MTPPRSTCPRPRTQRRVRPTHASKGNHQLLLLQDLAFHPDTTSILNHPHSLSTYLDHLDALSLRRGHFLLIQTLVSTPPTINSIPDGKHKSLLERISPTQWSLRAWRLHERAHQANQHLRYHTLDAIATYHPGILAIPAQRSGRACDTPYAIKTLPLPKARLVTILTANTRRSATFAQSIPISIMKVCEPRRESLSIFSCKTLYTNFTQATANAGATP